ncbi:DUF3558 domain-containing protein [Bounagaea algeriensis]
MKRGAMAAMALVSAGALAGCTSGGDEGTGTADQAQGQPSQKKQQSGVQIDSPKDASQVDMCGLVPPELVEKFGFSPEGKSETSITTGEEMCRWSNPDEGGGLSFSAIGDRSLQTYLDNPDKYVDFEQVQIAGHPAVRANEGNPQEDGFCDFFVALNDNQVLSSQATATNPGVDDPCQISRQGAEEAVSNIPAK